MSRTRVHALHRFLALGLGIFLASHIGIHLTILHSAELHMRTLSAIQPLYRNPVVEPILVVAILSQVIVGGRLLVARWRSPGKGFWGWVQIASGLYLAYFLVLHTGAALAARYVFGLETNTYWAAGPLQTIPLVYGFVPYYTLGVFSVFAHLAVALHYSGFPVSRFLSRACLAGGAVTAGLIVAGFAGAYYDIPLPAAYLEFYSAFADAVS